LYVVVHEEPAELALQLTPIWLEEVAVAMSKPGILGAVLQPVLPPALTVTMAVGLVAEPAAFVTTTAKLLPLFCVVRGGVVYVAAVAPAMGPPLLCHWYVSGAVPVAVTLKVAVCPAVTVIEVGGTVMVGFVGGSF
jgi:hypothetical protein